jgi:hypothetical protein
MPEYIRKNCERLAREVVEGWDLETLVEYAVENLTASYIHNKDAFLDDWENIGLDS